MTRIFANQISLETLKRLEEGAVILSRADDEGPPKRSNITQTKTNVVGSVSLVERESD